MMTLAQDMMEFEIRRYRESDRDAVVDLWRECGLVMPWNDPVKDINRKLRVQRDMFLVGSVGGQLVATVMAGYEGHRGWINYLAVATDYQKMGYGRRLMEEAESRLRAVGCVVWCGIRRAALSRIRISVRPRDRRQVPPHLLGYGGRRPVHDGRWDDPGDRRQLGCRIVPCGPVPVGYVPDVQEG